MEIESKLAEMGLTLPPPLKPPPGVVLPFSFVRIHAGIAYISGHGPQQDDGALAGPFGKVGADLSVEQAYDAAKAVALSMLGSLKRELGDLGPRERLVASARHGELRARFWRSACCH